MMPEFPGEDRATVRSTGWEVSGQYAEPIEWSDPDDPYELSCCEACSPEDFSHTWWCTRTYGHEGSHVAGTSRNAAAAVWMQS